jgi:hypothetical protein
MLYTERGWAWVERITWIIVIFGIPLFFVEQYLQIQREKVSATLEFMKKYQDAHLVSQRFILLEPWTQYDLQTLRLANPSTRAMDDLVIALINKSAGSSRDMREAIFNIVDFYDTLELCIRAGRCDRKLAIAYFQGYAKQFFCLYSPYIQRLKNQQSMPEYGSRLERFAVAGGDCSPSTR